MSRLLIFLTAFMLAMPVGYAAPPEGKGKDKDTPAQSQGQGREEAPGQSDRTPPGQADRTPPGQDRAADAAASRSEHAVEAAANRAERAEAKADNRADRAEDRSERAEANVDRQHPHQERGSLDRADRQTGARDDRATDHRRDPAERGREAARQRVASLVDSLNKLEHARWSFNPHDTRGQGNMGKPRMQDPFGFDKDSGREGRDRGRPIREVEAPPEEPPTEEPPVEEPPVFDITTDLTSSLQLVDPYVLLYQSYILWYQQLAAAYPNLADWYAQTIAYTEDLITARIAEVEADTTGYWSDLGVVEPAEPLVVDDSLDAVAYTLNLSAPDTFTGTTLQVTTTLTSVWDQDVVTWDVTQPAWDPFATINHFEEGEVVWQATEEITLSADGTAAYAYNIPIADAFANDLTGYGGNYLKLTVTVTDPATGTSYLISDDRLRVYRCPYGIVYDKTTSRPIVGATVTVHNADGSIVLLDKASNPNVSNPQTTDATGRYNAKLAIGKKYYLTVKAPGYEEYKSLLFSERWHIVREDVGLTRVGSETTPAPTPTFSTPVPVDSGMPAVSPAALPVK